MAQCAQPQEGDKGALLHPSGFPPHPWGDSWSHTVEHHSEAMTAAILLPLQANPLSLRSTAWRKVGKGSAPKVGARHYSGCCGGCVTMAVSGTATGNAWTCSWEVTNCI